MKKYIKPNCEVVEYSMETAMLAASGINNTYEEEGDGIQRAPKYDLPEMESVWGDDTEE